MTRTFAFLTFLAGLSCTAADNPAAGKWDCTSTDARGTTIAWTLTVKEDAGSLSGSLTGPGMEMPLSDARVSGNILKFKIAINPEEMVEFHLTIDGRKLDGRFKGIQAGAGTFKGVRP